jgi:PIN domain nuclease of toxin-antitoxin system
MKILLDTCEFLWFISADPALSAAVRREVQDSANEVYLSVVSVWEVIVKHTLGKLSLPQPPAIYIPAQRSLHGIRSLSLEESAVQRLAGLPVIHRDPFDRMLICQAQDLGLILASSDTFIRQYPVTLL